MPWRTRIKHLQGSYIEYMASLKQVLDFGEANVPALIAALNHKHANPIARAIGLMMHSREAEKAIPTLLDWLVVQSPLYPDVLEALVRAGDKSLPLLHRSRIMQRAATTRRFGTFSTSDGVCPTKPCRTSCPLLRGSSAAKTQLSERRRPMLSGELVCRTRTAEPQLRKVASRDEVESVRNAVTEAITRISLAQ